MINFDKIMCRNLSNVVGSIFQPLIHYNTFSHNIYIVSKIVKNIILETYMIYYKWKLNQKMKWRNVKMVT